MTTSARITVSWRAWRDIAWAIKPECRFIVPDKDILELYDGSGNVILTIIRGEKDGGG